MTEKMAQHGRVFVSLAKLFSMVFYCFLCVNLSNHMIVNCFVLWLEKTSENMFESAEFCRICLSRTNELVALKNEDVGNLRLDEQLIFINPDLIPLNDQFPKWVCIYCKKQINDAYCLLEKIRESYSVLDKLIKHVQTTGQTNLLITDGNIKDLLKIIPDVNEEIEIKYNIENVDIKNEGTPDFVGNQVKTTDGNTKDLTKINPETNEEIDIKHNTKNTEETPDLITTKKDTTKVLKVRSISSINAIINSPAAPIQAPVECILGGTTQDANLLGISKAPDEEPSKTINIDLTQQPRSFTRKPKTPITVLFNPKNGRIVPLKKPAEPPAEPPPPPPSINPFFAQNVWHTCTTCHKTFRSQVGYTVHKNWHERLDRNVPGVEYTCDYCQRPPYKTLGGLKRHLDGHSAHFKRTKRMKQKEANAEMAGTKFGCLSAVGPVCGQCRRVFVNFRELNRHRKNERHETHKIYKTKA